MFGGSSRADVQAPGEIGAVGGSARSIGAEASEAYANAQAEAFENMAASQPDPPSALDRMNAALHRLHAVAFELQTLVDDLHNGPLRPRAEMPDWPAVESMTDLMNEGGVDRVHAISDSLESNTSTIRRMFY